MSKYYEVYFVDDNQAINRVRVDSSKTRNRGAFSDSLAVLIYSILFKYVFHLHFPPTWYFPLECHLHCTVFLSFSSFTCTLKLSF